MARLRVWAPTLGGLVLLLLATSARSSGGDGGTPRWKLANTVFTGYDNNVALVPGNDSRVNLLLLLMDRRGAGAFPAAPRKVGESSDPPSAFFDWSGFRDSLTPAASAEGDSGGSASRCDSNDAGARAFVAALNADRSVPDADRRALIAARESLKPGCDSGEKSAMTPLPAVGAPAEPFATYLEGARAFYDGDFAGAGRRFAALGGALNGWLREAGLYMVARSALNQAQLAAFDDYGSLAEPAKRDRAASEAAASALQAYLRAYPAGAYAASAQGLMRRAYWLMGDRVRLAGEYAKLFALPPDSRPGASDFTLVEEIDQKLLVSGSDGLAADPALLAVADLMRMRVDEESSPYGGVETPISRAEIEAQRGSFARDEALYGLVLASHTLFVAKRPAEVLKLIPDAARQTRLGPVQFGRQMLRGFALEALRDPNTRGFWLELIGGATQPYQRPAVELALALHEERNNGLARVFAPGSPIRDPRIRGILLGYAAGPDILRQQARDKAAPQAERDTALFVLLAKQLGRGLYAGFLGDLALVRPGAPADGNFQSILWRDEAYGERGPAPLGLFTAARGYGEIGCPALREVAAQLARNPRAPRPMLCLGEFMRGYFDQFVLDSPPPRGELGGAASQFPGKPYARLEVYKAVMNDPAATPDDKAYALYRAVRCYAPAGNNDCGGVEVAPAVRRAWFLRLKREFPQSSWAKKSDRYW